MTATATAGVPTHAGILIIGGGIMGTSIAFHLAEAGHRDIVVVEAASLGSGSSGKPIGGVRAQFSDPTNIELGLRSLAAYEAFASRPGGDIRLERAGYLFLLTDDVQAKLFEDSMALQHEYGVPTRMISPREVHELCPYVPASAVVAGSFSALDGHARPGEAVRGYADAARRLGVRFVTGVAVTGIDTERGAISAVETDVGTIATDTVVCAAGAWSSGIGAMVGENLPITPVKRQLAFTEPGSVTRHQIPFTLDFSTSAYFHNADDALLLGYADPAQEPGFDREWTPEWLELFRDFARVRAPELAEARIASGWAGLYEVTPDKNALIGRSSVTEGFFYAAGFSGHGFLQGPAVGEVMRDLVGGRTPFVDVSRFSADRFAPGADGLVAEVNVI